MTANTLHHLFDLNDSALAFAPKANWAQVRIVLQSLHQLRCLHRARLEYRISNHKRIEIDADLRITTQCLELPKTSLLSLGVLEFWIASPSPTAVLEQILNLDIPCRLFMPECIIENNMIRSPVADQHLHLALDCEPLHE